jgi:hypothetical protein
MGADIVTHKLLAFRALVIFFALGSAFSGTLAVARQEIVFDMSRKVWGESELWRQVWVRYGLPFVAVNYLGMALLGWVIARLHPGQAPAFLVLCAASMLIPPTLWAWQIGELLLAGDWPFWDRRLSLLFHAGNYFVVNPAMLLVGGLWVAREQAGFRNESSSAT